MDQKPDEEFDEKLPSFRQKTKHKFRRFENFYPDPLNFLKKSKDDPILMKADKLYVDAEMMKQKTKHDKSQKNIEQ